MEKNYHNLNQKPKKFKKKARNFRALSKIVVISYLISTTSRSNTKSLPAKG